MQKLTTKGNNSVILLGRAGDTVPRPSWALDGSFLAFRLLQQLVPEFSRFLAENAPDVGDPSVDTAALLGARLTGRWHSGAPVPLTPLRDDPALATRNDFTFAPGSQEQCPFAAHVRKMNPRGDVDVVNGINPHRVLRRGIPYGPEVGAGEREASRTKEDRGLLFVCYQSNLSNGFQFLQKSKHDASFLSPCPCLLFIPSLSTSPLPPRLATWQHPSRRQHQ